MEQKKKNKDESPLSSKSKKTSVPINLKDFIKQEKEFNFTQKEIIDYRNSVKDVYKIKNFNERLSNINNLSTEIYEITKEKKQLRKKYDIGDYGHEKYLYTTERLESGDYRYAATTRTTKKVVAYIDEKEEVSFNKIKEKLIEKVKKLKFDYKDVYIPEDSEPQKKSPTSPDEIINYDTIYRYGIIIYRMKDGRKYEVIYRNNDAQAKGTYVSYQRIIAQMKQDIFDKTKITLEEWIYISKTNPSIHLEGGLKYTRNISQRPLDSDYKKYSKKDIKPIYIDFEDL